MKLTNTFCLVIVTFFFSTFGFYKNHKIIYKDANFIVSTIINIDSTKVDITNIQKQLQIMGTFFSWLTCPDSVDTQKDSLPKPLLVYMTKNDGLTGFQDKKNQRVVEFDNTNMIKSIMCTPCARKITEEEYEYFRKNNKVIPGMNIISENDAIEKAQKFFSNLLMFYGMQNDISVYDSVIVNLHLNHGRYKISFLSKIKNHIRDNREAVIAISPINGQVLRFYTPMGLLVNQDLNYKPKFKYEQVSELIEELRINNKFHMYESRGLLLQPFHQQWKKWVWVLTGFRDSTSYHASYLVIDSKTGEILTNQFGN